MLDFLKNGKFFWLSVYNKSQMNTCQSLMKLQRYKDYNVSFISQNLNIFIEIKS